MQRRATGNTRQNIIPTGNLILSVRGHNSLVDEVGNFTPSGGGISYANGIFSGSSNEAIEFNSSTDVITISDSSLLTFSNGVTDTPFTLMSTVYRNSHSAVGEVFIKRGALTSNNEYLFRIDTSGRLYIALYSTGSATSYMLKVSTNTLSTSTGYVIAMTYDASSTLSGINCYIGTATTLTKITSWDTETNLSYVRMSNTNANLYMGNNINNNQNFNGFRSDINIFNKELTEAEIQACVDSITNGIPLL